MELGRGIPPLLPLRVHNGGTTVMQIGTAIPPSGCNDHHANWGGDCTGMQVLRTSRRHLAGGIKAGAMWFKPTRPQTDRGR